MSRSNRTGESITKLADGKFQARVWDPRRRKPTRLRFASHAAAQRWIVEQRGLVADGAELEAGKGQRNTVADELARWLKAARGRRRSWKPQTRAMNASAVRSRFPEWLMATPATDLEVDDVETWITELEERGLSANTVNQALGMLGAALGRGVVARRLSRNVARECAGVDAGRREPAPVVDHEAIMAVRDALPDAFQVGADLAYGAGLRLGEVLGLTVDRVDFMRGYVTVDRQYPARGGVELVPTKTSNTRTFPITDDVVHAINAHIAAHGLGDGGLIVHTANGGPCGHRYWQGMWDKARTEAGHEAITTHQLRHAFGSVHLNAGTPGTSVAMWMGHTYETFARVYAHHEVEVRPTVSVLSGTRVAHTAAR